MWKSPVRHILGRQSPFRFVCIVFLVYIQYSFLTHKSQPNLQQISLVEHCQWKVPSLQVAQPVHAWWSWACSKNGSVHHRKTTQSEYFMTMHNSVDFKIQHSHCSELTVECEDTIVIYTTGASEGSGKWYGSLRPSLCCSKSWQEDDDCVCMLFSRSIPLKYGYNACTRTKGWGESCATRLCRARHLYAALASSIKT